MTTCRQRDSTAAGRKSAACLSVAVRLDSNPPSLQPMDLVTTQWQPVRYTLLNLPHYLSWRIGELINTL